MNKKDTRVKRARKVRARIHKLQMPRLCVLRTNYHIYAQLISPCGSKVEAAASTLEAAIKSDIKNTGNKDAAALVGKKIAERAKEKGINQVAFDRSGYKFHGRVKSLADAAREGGLQF